MNVSASTAANQAANAPSSSGGSSTPGSAMDGTFLNLLVTELKTQDPSSPLDANQMVAQMVSLNQLDQLIAIHSVLQNAVPASTTNSGGH